MLNTKEKILQFFLLLYTFIYVKIASNKIHSVAMPEQFKKFDKLYAKNSTKKTLLKSEFKLLNWNIERAYQIDKIKTYIEQNNFDIILFQETPTYSESEQPEFSKIKNFYAYCPAIFFNTKQKYEQFIHIGQLTLSDISFGEIKKILQPQVNFNSPFHCEHRFSLRNILYTRFFTKKGNLGIYNVHLEPFMKSKEKIKQLECLAEEMKKNNDEYIILAGDWNILLREKKIFSDFLTEKRLLQAQTKGTSWKGIGTLDYIFHTQNMKVITGTDNFKASDHYPICAKIELC